MEALAYTALSNFWTLSTACGIFELWRDAVALVIAVRYNRFLIQSLLLSKSKPGIENDIVWVAIRTMLFPDA